jgi:predicted Zn-dependent protease
MKTTLLCIVLLVLTTPFNLGGCSDVTSAVGGAVGGSQGEALGRAGGQLVEAESINDSDQQAMGESVAMAVTSRYPIVRDNRLNQYVALVGLTLANASNRPDANWLYAVVETPEVNAFSGPDGYILITRGLVRDLHDESELAGVLAHEMAHVLEKHGLQAVKQAGRAKAFSSALQADERLGAFSDATNGLVDTVLVKGYDRKQEEEADARAVRLVINAGYDPLGYYNFLQRLAKEQSSSGGGGAMSTHPGAGERAKKVRQRIDELAPAKQGAINRERFEKMVGTAVAG